MTDLASRTIGQLAPELRRRTISPVEVLAAVLERIDRLEPVLRTYVSIDRDAAVSAAREAEREIAAGRWRGPLHGIPLAVKDCLAVAGWPTTNASPLMAEHRTEFDATAVRRLRAAGAVIVGKSNMHEWAMGGTCTGMPAGTVRNPWDVERVPGGSSGGSAAAVSAGLALGAIGTDGMGSIRTPASYCGVVGLKPTRGLVPRFGELPPNSSLLGSIGPLARDVRDAATILAAIAGPDETDPTSRRRLAGWRLDPDDLRPDVDGLRIGLPLTSLLDDATPAVRAAVAAAATALEGLGGRVRDVPLPALDDVRLVVLGTQSEAQSFLLPLALDRPDGFASRDIRNRIIANDFVRAADARRALQLRTRIRLAVAEAMADLDLLLLPTNSTAAFPIGTGRVAIGSGDDVVDLGARGGQSRLTTRLTLPFNVVGLPALSMPAVDRVDGLPIGLQLVAHASAEPVLLRAALALEEATTGGFVEPPIAGRAAAALLPASRPVAALGATR